MAPWVFFGPPAQALREKNFHAAPRPVEEGDPLQSSEFDPGHDATCEESWKPI